MVESGGLATERKRGSPATRKHGGKNRCIISGGVAEWLKAAVLKTVVPFGYRGFESYLLRQFYHRCGVGWIRRCGFLSSAETRREIPPREAWRENPTSSANLPHLVGGDSFARPPHLRGGGGGIYDKKTARGAIA